MAADYLFNHTDLLAKYFGSDVIAADQYCVGTRAFDWQSGKPLHCRPGEHERMLREFLCNDPAGQSKAGLDVLVLIGGIGTGKTTTVRGLIGFLQGEKRTCSASSESENACRQPPIIVDLDVSDIYGESGRRGVDKERGRQQLEDFWNIAASRLERILAGKVHFESEAAFWAWALEKETLRDRSAFIHRWLNDCEHQIRALATRVAYSGWSLEAIAQSLERRRSELMSGIPTRDLVWYRVFQLIYAIQVQRSFSCSCRYVILDNVDQLEPEVQTEVVNFTILLSDVLRARTLVAIRPLTWERSVHAHMLVRTQNHFSPSLRDVFQRRLERLAHARVVPDPFLAYLRSIVLPLTTPKSLWGKMFEATSGLSVRFAIRNFLNLTQSRLLPPIGEINVFKKMRSSEIARAFFFGEGENILHGNLENLYGLGTDMRAEFRLIKPRILDYIVRVCDGQTTLDELCSSMTRFNYSQETLIKALNDLLWRSRPLLWCQAGHQLGSVAGSAKIAATPIGRGYRDKLFGQLYYDEVCIAHSSHDVVTLERVVDFHRQLWRQDYDEIIRAVRKHGSGFYLSLYPRDMPAISAMHAVRLSEGVKRRDLPLAPGYDVERLAFITKEVEKLLGPRW